MLPQPWQRFNHFSPSTQPSPEKVNSNPRRPRVLFHENIIQPSTNRLPYTPITESSITIRRFLQILQNQWTVSAEGFGEGEDGGVSVDDGLSDGGRNADDFLQHFGIGVGFVVAGSHLAWFGTEGGGEVHAL